MEHSGSIDADNMLEHRLLALVQSAACYPWILILPHTDPDPDAIASAVALQFLLKERGNVDSRIAYSGIVGRAENKALVRFLGNPLDRLAPRSIREAPALALVDTQPGAGNNALPQDQWAALVIDHHPLREATNTAAFGDVRPAYGSTSTILWEYLRNAGLQPDAKLVTALFYGIKTDTMGLGRGASAQDVSAYFDLQPRIDVEALVEIEQAQVPPAYFRGFADALGNTKIYDGLVITELGKMRYPDLAAEMADELSRLRAAKWVIAMGVFRKSLIVSVRTRGRGAGSLAQAIVGPEGSAGGHGAYAGGQIQLREHNEQQLKSQLIERALEHLGLDPGKAPSALLDL